MLARLQKFIVALLLASSVGGALLLAGLGHPIWGGAIAALILLGYALFLALEFVLLYLMQEPTTATRAGAGDLLRAWWGEVVTAPRVFLWRQPFLSNVEPDHVPSGVARRGVVLVHGFVCNRGLWNPWMSVLRARDVPFIAVNLEPLFGSIDDYAQIIEAAVAKLESSTGVPPVLVGHSMGGLAIRAWMQRFGSDARVHRVITIGSPHQGTWLARFGRTTNGLQMRQRGSWLTRLAADEPLARAARFTCLYGHCDNIVFPALTGTLPGALNIHIARTAHVQMAFHPAVFDEVWRWLVMPLPARSAQS